MRALVLAALAAWAGTAPAAAQPAPADTSAPADAAAASPPRLSGTLDATAFRVYHGDGRPASFGDVLDAMASADAVFLGEQHDDTPAHALELRFLEAAHERYGGTRPVVLTLEMIERDAQLVLDEYLAGTIRERDFLAASRPWGNYAADYRPLVEFARAHGLPVVAANAPGRYVSALARGGAAALGRLSPEAWVLLPPHPVAQPSDSLAARFRRQMEAMTTAHGGTSAAPTHGASPHGTAAMPTVAGLLAAQNLRDAAMAEAVARALAARPGALVLHVNGSFHSERGQGIPEHLARYRPGTRALVVTMRKAERLDAPPAPSPGDDFVILTRDGG